uniref:Uncharacterized protein n=1 Tax=Leersia perrieri TaxID=77586 RepID=A0A0D9W954_9ORYZ
MAEADAQTQSRAPHLSTAPPAAGEAAGEQIGFPQNGAPNAAPLMFPVMYPMFMNGMHPQDDQAQGPGIYAIQQNQFMGSTLIPLTYTVPTESVGAAAGAEQGQDARQQHGPQRQVVVRRFHFAFQLDLALIIKYQTGAITPLLRWLQRAGGAAARPPQAPARPENRAPLAAQNDGNVQPPGGNIADPANNGQAAENQEPGAAAGNENQQEVEGEGNRRNWLGGIFKEVQLIVVGFVASLLPGFQHND